MEKTEREIQDEVRRLRWEAEAMEAQMKINQFVGMGFRSWQNHKDVNEGDAVVTVHNDYTVGFIPHVDLKNWSFYNMTMWIHPKDISPRHLETVKRKMDYNSRCYFRKWLGESFEGDWNYTI